MEQAYRSVQFSRSVVSDSLQPHGLQHARLPCPSPTPGAWSNSCPSGQWCHPTTSSSVVPFPSCLKSFPATGSFPISQFFASGSQNIGVSASASVLPMKIQDWLPLGLTGLISEPSKKGIIIRHIIQEDFPGGSDSKASVSTRETWVQSLGWEDPLEKEMAIHSSSIAWKIPWTEEPGRLQSMGSQRVGHNWGLHLYYTNKQTETQSKYFRVGHNWTTEQQKPRITG